MKNFLLKIVLALTPAISLLGQVAPNAKDTRWSSWTGSGWVNLTASVQNLTTLRATSVSGMVTGNTIFMQGYATAGDGGGGIFVYSSSSSATDDGGIIIAPNTGSGRWLRSFSGGLDVRWYGARGDAGVTDDHAAIQAAINAAASYGSFNGGLVIIPASPGPAGTRTIYKIGTVGITVPSYIHLQGGGPRATQLNYTGSGSAISTTDSTGVYIENLLISPGSSATSTALLVSASTTSVLSNRFEHLEIDGLNAQGQIGIHVNTSVAGALTSACLFNDIQINNIDKSVVSDGGGDDEGNIWTNLVISSWGANGDVNAYAMDFSCNANFFSNIRISGVISGVTNATGFRLNSGTRNIVTFSADFGATPAKALVDAGSSNVFMIERALDNTPIGTYSTTDTIIDPDAGIVAGAGVEPNQTIGIIGTNTNNNAIAGSVGEFVSSTVASGSAVSLSSSVSANVTSIALTAGDWEIDGVIDLLFGGGTSASAMYLGTNTASAVISGQDQYIFNPVTISSPADNPGFLVPGHRYSLSSPTTIYLVANITFSVSTLKAFGTIRARRVR